MLNFFPGTPLDRNVGYDDRKNVRLLPNQMRKALRRVASSIIDHHCHRSIPRIPLRLELSLS
jgi:hypothetical protein